MITKHRNVLFYSSLTLIMGVNLILGAALFSHLILNRPVVRIEWILGVFAAEILTCFARGWRNVIDLTDKKAVFADKPDNKGIVVMNQSSKPLVIQKVRDEGDSSYANLFLKKRGDDFLDKARNAAYRPADQKHFADEAIRDYAAIEDGTRESYLALYQTGTALRIKGKSVKAIETYLKFQNFLMEVKGRLFTEAEATEHISAAEMMIGIVLQEQNRIADAERCYIKAWKTNPKNFVTLLNAFELACVQENLTKAEMWADILRTYDEYSSFSGVVENQLQFLKKKRRKR